MARFTEKATASEGECCERAPEPPQQAIKPTLPEAGRLRAPAYGAAPAAPPSESGRLNSAVQPPALGKNRVASASSVDDAGGTRCTPPMEYDASAACEKQAADKKLAGAAKTSFTKKCVTDGGPAAAGKPDAAAACDKQAAEKKLAGAAKTSFTKKCVADAKG